MTGSSLRSTEQLNGTCVASDGPEDDVQMGAGMKDASQLAVV